MPSLFDFDAPPDHYAVMGNPIAHSKSPAIHAEFARQTGERIRYTAIQVDEGGFEQAVGNFAASGGKGLNITVPFKHEAWEFVDQRSPRAERAGAVNTIVLHEDGSLLGDNTDGVGLVADITVNHQLRVAGRRVLVVGAGGAVRGVLEPLLDQRPAELFIANRTADRAVTLAGAFADCGPVSGGGLDALEGRSFDLVINGTSASLHGDALQFPAGLLAPGSWCYDMMYGAQAEPFLRWAQGCGAAGVADGLGMLVEQAAESFYVWRGVRPQTLPVIEKLRRETGGR